MTALFQKDASGWRLISPVPYSKEEELHSIVEQSPQLLPLAGSPQLTVLGREVQLGNGWADLVAIEPSGRLVVIEVKLRNNSEARRAVIAQVLMYAAYLRGLDLATLEHDILADHLRKRNHATLTDAVAGDNQEGSFDPAAFERGVSASLVEGRFRLVLVLDEAPPELVRLVGYLASVAEKVLIDLITVSTYRVGDSEIAVPQRIDPEYTPSEPSPFVKEQVTSGRLVDGSADFRASIDSADPKHVVTLTKLCDWAEGLERDGLCRLSTYHGKTGLILLPRLRAGDAGLVTIWHDRNGGYLQLWRSVFDKRAPGSIDSIERVVGKQLTKGVAEHQITDNLLQALTAAYVEGATGRVASDDPAGAGLNGTAADAPSN